VQRSNRRFTAASACDLLKEHGVAVFDALLGSDTAVAARRDAENMHSEGKMRAAGMVSLVVVPSAQRERVCVLYMLTE
jgi:hypothetical protein